MMVTYLLEATVPYTPLDQGMGGAGLCISLMALALASQRGVGEGVVSPHAWTMASGQTREDLFIQLFTLLSLLSSQKGQRRPLI